MKLLWWAPSFPPDVGGMATHGAHLLPALAAFGINATAVINRDRAGVEQLDGFVVHRLTTRTSIESGDGAEMLRFRRAIGTLVSEIRPDLVHVHLPDPTAILLEAIPSLRDLPLVVTLHSPVAVVVPPSSSALLDRLLDRARVIVTVSGAGRADLVATRPAHAAKIVAVPNAVPHRPRPDSVAAGAEDAAPIVLAAGRCSEHKGFDTLIRAVVPLRMARPEVRIVIAGDGALRSSLEAMARELGVADIVQFVGAVDTARMQELLGQATVVAMPSRRWEGHPYMALEAAAAGRAVVGSDVEGLRETIGDGGWLVAPDDPVALSAALDVALGPEGVARGIRAWENSARDSIPAQVRSHVEVYRTAADPWEPGLVSVVIATHDSGGFLAEAVDSVLNTGTGTADGADDRVMVEVIVVDDASTDESVTALESDPRVRIVRQAHGGSGAARNAGMAVARGEFLTFLDADDRWPVGRLAPMVRALRDDPSLEAVFGSATRFGAGLELEPTGAAVRIITTALIRTECARRVGGFWSVPTGDAVDWTVRFVDAGARYVLLDDHLALERRVHDANKGRGDVAQRNRLKALQESLARRRAQGAQSR